MGNLGSGGPCSFRAIKGVFLDNCRVLKGGGGNWGTLRIPGEDWGTLGKIRGITNCKTGLC